MQRGLGFGLKIEGRGESVGERAGPDGQRASSLRFWSDDPKSLIREGSGYWRYVPENGGVRFLTLYDYRVRYGPVGALFDRVCFRPVMGWATAWSFDRLRLWMEAGVPPETTLRLTLVYSIARLSAAFVWLWHGFIPKLIFHHPDEIRMLLDAGISAAAAEKGVFMAGCFEVLLGLGTLLFWRSRAPLVLTVALMVAATALVTVYSPEFLRKAFNPVTLNLLLMSAACIALLTQPFIASAARCRRVKPQA